MNLKKGFGDVLVPNIQRVPVPKPVLFGKVSVPDSNIDVHNNKTSISIKVLFSMNRNSVSEKCVITTW